MRGGTEANLKCFFFLFLNEYICCDPSFEPSQRDGSNDGSQHTCDPSFEPSQRDGSNEESQHTF